VGRAGPDLLPEAVVAQDAELPRAATPAAPAPAPAATASAAVVAAAAAFDAGEEAGAAARWGEDTSHPRPALRAAAGTAGEDHDAVAGGEAVGLDRGVKEQPALPGLRRARRLDRGALGEPTVEVFLHVPARGPGWVRRGARARAPLVRAPTSPPHPLRAPLPCAARGASWPEVVQAGKVVVAEQELPAHRRHEPHYIAEDDGRVRAWYPVGRDTRPQGEAQHVPREPVQLQVPTGGTQPPRDGRLHAADARKWTDARPCPAVVIGGEEESCTWAEEEVCKAAEPVLKRSASIDADSAFRPRVEQTFARQATQRDAKVCAEAIATWPESSDGIDGAFQQVKEAYSNTIKVKIYWLVHLELVVRD
jgi:hypothetical protein